MIEVHRLVKMDDSVLKSLESGYESMEYYRVAKSETPERTEIVLSLTRHPALYQKHWEITPEDRERYDQVVMEGHSFGAYDGEKLVAVALAEVRSWNRTLWIWEFHVTESHKRQGIGRKLMDILAEEARILQLRTMLVETQNTNLPAIRFYRAVGFEIESVDLSYYTNHDTLDGEVAIFMKRKVES
jgi:ribosomal protein S18 acetylase RimI-like enzyme